MELGLGGLDREAFRGLHRKCRLTLQSPENKRDPKRPLVGPWLPTDPSALQSR